MIIYALAKRWEPRDELGREEFSCEKRWGDESDINVTCRLGVRLCEGKRVSKPSLAFEQGRSPKRRNDSMNPVSNVDGDIYSKYKWCLCSSWDHAVSMKAAPERQHRVPKQSKAPMQMSPNKNAAFFFFFWFYVIVGRHKKGLNSLFVEAVP